MVQKTGVPVMMYTSEQQEKFFVSQIKWIMQIPNPDVYIFRFIEKQVVPVVKIIVHAGVHRFVLEEIPGNSYSIDVVVNNKKMWITSSDCVNDLLNIKQNLLQSYEK